MKKFLCLLLVVFTMGSMYYFSGQDGVKSKYQSDSVVKIIGGEYYAYTGDSTKASAIVGQSGANSVSVLYGVSAPTLARSGFYQTHAVLQYGGIINCADMITELTINVMSGASSVRGTITKSKNNVW
jgi:hypothetical protein